MTEEQIARAREVLDHANAIMIECLSAKADQYYVIDTSKAEPEVNWPGENLTQLVSFEEAKRVRDATRADILQSFADEARLAERGRCCELAMLTIGRRAEAGDTPWNDACRSIATAIRKVQS